MSDKEAGDIVFLTTIAYVPGTLIGGRLSDRFGRKRVQMISQFLCGAALLPCGFISDPHLIAIFIVASVFFDGVTDPARSAMSADFTTPENRQAAFSFIYLGHNLGFAMGQLIAGFLFNSAPSWMFWGNALAIGISLGVVAVFLPESKPSAEAEHASLMTASAEKAHEGGLLSALLSRPTLLVFAVLTSLYSFVYAHHRFALPIQATDLFGDSGAKLYGFVMTMNALLVLAFTTPIVAFTRRYKPIVNMASAGVLYAVGFGLLAFARLPWLFFASTFLWTMGEIVQATNESVYVTNHTPMSHRGRFNSVLPLIAGIGFSVSTPIAGRIADSAGLATVWIVVFLTGSAGAFGILLLGKYERGKQSLLP
jgi:MFS family permease